MRRVRMELEPVAEPERLCPLAVGRAEVADEAGDDVQLRVRERLQERPRVALAEEAARVRDREAARRAGTRAPRSRRSRSRSGSSRPLLAARARAPRRRSRPPRPRSRRLCGHDAGDRGCSRLLGPDGEALGAAVRMSGDRVAQVGHPARVGQALDGGADEVDRVRRRGRDHRVDPLLPARSGSPREWRSGSSSRSRRARAAGARTAASGRRAARGPRCRGARRPGASRSGRRSARGAPRPASAARPRRRGGPTSGRRGRERASRSRTPAGAWRASATAGRRRRPAGGK